MSSLRRVRSSKANGAVSKGPITPAGKHVDLFQPANQVEFGMIEEMCAAYWPQRPPACRRAGTHGRQHLMYQRAVRTLAILRTAGDPNGPSPISEHTSDPLIPSHLVGQPILAAAGFQPAIAPRRPPPPQPARRVGQASWPVAPGRAPILRQAEFPSSRSSRPSQNVPGPSRGQASRNACSAVRFLPLCTKKHAHRVR
jgi:hypothetical protein